MVKEEMIGEVDLDNSSIEINNEMMTTKELKSTIKSKIENGDFDVTLYANALKKLEKVLNNIEEVQLVLPLNVLNEYKSLAKKSSSTVESALRKGVTEYLIHHDKLEPEKDEDVAESSKGSKSKKKRK